MPTLSGQLLIAAPDLIDGNFFRTAVLLFQHSEEGAAGLVLNRPLSVTLPEACPDLEISCASELSLNWGGPVSGPLMALHTSLVMAEIPVFPGVFLSMQRPNIEGLISQSVQPYRLFAGYSGWGAGQLETELESGGWLLFPAGEEHVFADGDTLWKQLCQTIGSQVTVPKPRSQSAQFDPTWN